MQEDHNHAKKITDIFVSSHYINEFQEWLTEADTALVDKLLRNIMQEQYGVDITSLTLEAKTLDDVIENEIPAEIFT